MPGPIPCLGYPSRTAAVLALRGQGLSSRQIARRIGIEVKTVTALEGAHNNHRKGFERQGRPAGSILVDPAIVRAFRPHAARRGMSAGALIDRMLTIALEDGLIDALLDDNAAEAGPDA
ncbi:hypothetical protein ACFQ1E_17500 [Sphingomonas canadensis]|uniref:HTH luxR-type domain-containing protein n=1 Tax=Sphingomonas canadensis TaxID=1219257 RepID=A0ABW3HF42_9SPHN|nr:hypothetical protein [Sphingomonas canadensis]MCW3837843.1 hypothetical protein [Sphingomonas canadensis]